MSLTLTDRQCSRLAVTLRRGAMDSQRIADALDPAGRTHFFIEVNDMGQFAKDWETLKTLIRQKDDALDRQAQQLDQQAKQIAALQQQASALRQQASAALDAEDSKALTELHQTIQDNAVPPPPNSPPVVPAPNVTTFKK